jgi:CheY-like chemotaxis protein
VTAAFAMERRPSPRLAESRPVNNSRPSILVIEDNAITRAGLATILDQHGYAVTAASTGRVGLDLLSGGLCANIILLDMLMPELDGWHFLERVRGTPFGRIPIVVMSGVGLSKEWATAAGCFDFLRKPFDEQDLLTTIGRALGLR